MSNEAQREKEVWRVLSDLDRETENLLQMSEDLERDLNQILQPQAPINKSVDTNEEHAVPMVNYINELLNKTTRTRERVESILARLEI